MQLQRLAAWHFGISVKKRRLLERDARTAELPVAAQYSSCAMRGELRCSRSDRSAVDDAKSGAGDVPAACLYLLTKQNTGGKSKRNLSMVTCSYTKNLPFLHCTNCWEAHLMLRSRSNTRPPSPTSTFIVRLGTSKVIKFDVRFFGKWQHAGSLRKPSGKVDYGRMNIAASLDFCILDFDLR